MSSYLRQKYDVAAEFTDTLRYNTTQAYKAGSRVYTGDDENNPTFYYAAYPFPVLDVNKAYRIGDKVWYKDHTYTAKQESPLLTHAEALQYGNTGSLPLQNVFPDDRLNGSAYWNDEGTYTVAAGTLSDATKWVKGDNRNPLLVMYCVDMAVYHLY